MTSARNSTNFENRNKKLHLNYDWMLPNELEGCIHKASHKYTSLTKYVINLKMVILPINAFIWSYQQQNQKQQNHNTFSQCHQDDRLQAPQSDGTLCGSLLFVCACNGPKRQTLERKWRLAIRVSVILNVLFCFVPEETRLQSFKDVTINYRKHWI